MPTDPEQAPPRSRDRSPLGVAKRVGYACIAVLVLAWAWDASDINIGKLVENRTRAYEHVFGRLPSDATIEENRRAAMEVVRGEVLLDVLDEMRAEYHARDEEPPGVMTLAPRARQRVADAIAAMGPRFEERVEERVRARAESGRQGGYLPPEVRLTKILGDPDELDSSLPNQGAGRLLRWLVVAVSGEGYTGQLAETIAIAIWGTLTAVVLAIPLSLLAAPRSLNIVAPGDTLWHRGLRWFSRFVVRRGFDISRGFNEVVMAVIFVAVLGLGPFPGVLALAVHTLGVLGKVFADAIETVEMGPIEGVSSTGAHSTQVISYAVMPQIMPFVVSQSLLRFESNVRGATILGVVGAGGIGQLLMDKFRAFEYQEVATMMILIIVVVTLIDFACGRIMKRFT